MAGPGLPLAEPGPPGETPVIPSIGITSTQRRIPPAAPCPGAVGTTSASSRDRLLTLALPKGQGPEWG